MNRDDLYREAKALMIAMKPCPDGGYEFACPSCVAQQLAAWAEGIYEQGREDVASDVLARVAGIYNKEASA